MQGKGKGHGEHDQGQALILAAGACLFTGVHVVEPAELSRSESTQGAFQGA